PSGATWVDPGLPPTSGITAVYGGDANLRGFSQGRPTLSLPSAVPACSVGGDGSNGSLAAVVAASTSEATALVSAAATAAYDHSVLPAQAYAEADELATRYLTSPPGPILAEAHDRRRR